MKPKNILKKLITFDFSRLTIIILACLIIVACLTTLLPVPGMDTLENSMIDWLFALRGPMPASDKLLIVYIGDDDIRALGGWPITRNYYAYLLHVLQTAGARVVGLDVLLDQPMTHYPEFDQNLKLFLESTERTCLPMTFAELRNSDSADVPIGISPIMPIPDFQESATGIGFSNLGPTTLVRTVPVIATMDDKYMLSFGAEMARQFLNDSCQVHFQHHRVHLVDGIKTVRQFKVDSHGFIRINFYGGLEQFHHMGLLELFSKFEQSPDSLDLKEHLVVVAVTASGIAKLSTTPLGSTLPATYVHANVADNVIQNNLLRLAAPGWQIVILLLVIGSILLISKIETRLWRVPGYLLLLIGYWAVATIIFNSLHLVLPLFWPTIGFIVVVSVVSVERIWSRHERLDAHQKILNEQIATKEIELVSAKQQLDTLKQQLDQESSKSEQTEQLANERQRAILKLEKDLRDLKVYRMPTKTSPQPRFANLIYDPSGSMAQVLAMVTTVSNDDIPVLIMGETGTGKEMIARAIHESSKRRGESFVAVNCGALPETLLESELFGHEKGSFTGAQTRRRGRFELADGGTIFLDEITETNAAFQARLLRVLQEGVFERIGGEQPIRVNVRVIAATNKDVQAEMEAARFRHDLFYRLNGFPISIPPLRERNVDIPLLAKHFLEKYDYKIASFSDRAMETLRAYHWPGNVRELENVVRRAAILAQSEGSDVIRENHLPQEIRQNANKAQAPQVEFQALEDQILEAMRSFEFSRSAISQTAKALGNRDRGTITEYVRGICFIHLIENDFNIERAAQTIANSTSGLIHDRVIAKINSYLENLKAALENLSKEDEIPRSIYQGLPKKYHEALDTVIKFLQSSVSDVDSSDSGLS
ncbi:sigma 54-interacting transcriptional regulator [candidate division KSB1 bacterium]|nr:sigma 54-interacting transcriptional regulator [candidate division KSB1 bacterium]